MSNRTLFLGTGDGLYRATAHDGAFSVEPTGFKGMGEFRAAVVVDRDENDTLYAGTTKAGMYRSRDFGRTWQEANAGITFKSIWSLEQHPKTGALHAGTSPTGVFISRDKGDTWQECEHLPTLPTTKGWTGPVPPHVSRLKGLALDANDPDYIYGAIEEGWAIRSLDGGKTWEQIAEGIDHDGHSVVILPEGPRSVLATTGKGMFRSDDAGDHWLPANAGLSTRHYTPSPIAVHPARPNTLLTAVTAVSPGQWRRPEGGDSAFARSDDGGRTWHTSSKGLPAPCVAVPRALVADPEDPDTFYSGMTDGTLWASSDGGDSFRQVLSGLPAVMSITALAR